MCLRMSLTSHDIYDPERISMLKIKLKTASVTKLGCDLRLKGQQGDWSLHGHVSLDLGVSDVTGRPRL